MVDKYFRFEGFTLDLERLRLIGQAGQVDLRPKSFEVLRYLIVHVGRVVTKDEVLRAVWPDVTVTDESLSQCIHDVRRALGSSGQKIIKTIPRRGYLLDVVVTAQDREPKPVLTTKGSPVAARYPHLPDRPSIAVLPFDNFSGDPKQEYFSNGITEDIITEISRFSELFVIARNSTFQYKGKAIDIRQIGRELGVRYVLEGSIRRDLNRVRITAQLIDADSGVHLWAERYDRQLHGIFKVQDEVARAIVTILTAHVRKIEAERTLLKPPSVWQAYDYYLRGLEAVTSVIANWRVEEIYEARRLLGQAIVVDPKYARAYALMSFTHTLTWVNPMDADHLNPAALDRAYELARKAVQLDPNLPQGHAELGNVLVWMHQHEASVDEFKQALDLNPNFTPWRFGLALIYAGEAARAIEVLEAFMRLDPFYPPLALGWIGFSHHVLKQYLRAQPLLRECVSRAPLFRGGHFWLAANSARLGLADEARDEVAAVLRIDPNYSIDGTQRRISVFKRNEDAEHYFEGLRMAGFRQ